MKQILAFASLASVLIAHGCGNQTSVAGNQGDNASAPPAVTAPRATPAIKAPAVTRADHTAPGRFFDEAHGFSFVPPAGWTAGPSVPPAFVTFFGQTTRGFRTNVNVNTSKDDGMPIEKAGDVVAPEMPKYFTDWKLIRGGLINIHGRPAYSISSKYRQGQFDIHMLQCIMRDNEGQFFTITFASLESEFPRLEKVFHQCAMTVLCGGGTRQRP